MRLTIDSMFAFVSIDSRDNSEGIIATQIGNLQWPLVGADMNRIDSYRDLALQVALASGDPVEIIRFTNREHVDWIKP